LVGGRKSKRRGVTSKTAKQSVRQHCSGKDKSILATTVAVPDARIPLRKDKGNRNEPVDNSFSSAFLPEHCLSSIPQLYQAMLPLFSHTIF